MLAAVLVVLSAFSWDRWFRFDDAADIQGNWQASGQAAVVVIDGRQMHLTDEVAYDYTLDTWAKTIDFSFGKLAGTGTYRFSDDRRTLTIIEGGDSDLIRDFLRMFGLDIGAEGEKGLPTTVFAKAADDAASPSGSDADQPEGGESGDGASPGADSAGVGAGGSADSGEGDGEEPGEGGSDAEGEPDTGSSDGEGGGSQNGADGGSSGGGILFDEINDRGVSS